MLVPTWMGGNTIDPSTKRIDLLDENRQFPLRPNSFYDALEATQLRMWQHYAARYLLVTSELIDFLRPLCPGDVTIEIGAGAGDLGKHLGVRMTDNWQQTWPEVAALYHASQQPVIDYPPEVENIDALEAVKKYQPDVVIGSWITQWIGPDLPPPPGGGNMWGVKEDEILKLVKKYIVVGAEEVHKYKYITKLPHKVIDAPFARSRRKDNRIWIWEGQKK